MITDQWKLHGRKITVTGHRGSLRWIEATYKNGKPKVSRAKATETHAIFRGGPWNGGRVRHLKKRKHRESETYELFDVWMAKDFDGWYVLDRTMNIYEWENP